MTLLQRIIKLEEMVDFLESSYSKDEDLLDLGDFLKEKFFKYNLKFIVNRGSKILKLRAEKLNLKEIRRYLNQFESERRIELKLILLGKNNFEVIKIK